MSQQLAQLQSAFQAYLIDNVKNAAFIKHITDDEKVGAQKRLGIYYDAYRLRIIEALATSYPKLKLLLGDDLFERSARAYIDTYPSTYQNMRWYGGHMREHLLYMMPEHPIAAEMAAFEWSLLLAFDAADTPALQLQDLAEIPPEYWSHLKFEFQPAIQVVRLRWNIVPVWKAFDVEAVPPPLMQDSIYTSWLIWRKSLNAQFRATSEMEVIALKMAMQGATFGEVCTYLERRDPAEHDSENPTDEAATEVTMMAAQYLAGWLQEEMISSVTLAD